MKKCRICEEFVDDSVNVCPVCQNSDFVDFSNAGSRTSYGGMNPGGSTYRPQKRTPMMDSQINMGSTARSNVGYDSAIFGGRTNASTDSGQNSSTTSSFDSAIFGKEDSAVTDNNETAASAEPVYNSTIMSDSSYSEPKAQSYSNNSFSDSGNNSYGGPANNSYADSSYNQNSYDNAAYGGAYNTTGGTYNETSSGYYNPYDNPQANQPASGRRMSRLEFCRNCVPPDLKKELNVAYGILILNIILASVMYYWFDESAYLLDIGILLIIYLGLVFTKHTAFAILNLLYFGASAIYKIVVIHNGRSVRSAVWMILTAFAVISVTRKVGHLWKEHKRTGMYVDYRKTPGAKNASVGKSIMKIAFIAVLVIGGIYLAMLGKQKWFSSFEAGTWKGDEYINTSLDMKIDLSGEEWYVCDAQEIKAINDEMKAENMFSTSATCEVMAYDETNGFVIALYYASCINAVDVEQKELEESIVETYTQDYGSANIVNRGQCTLAGQQYNYFDVFSAAEYEGYYDYERYLLKKVGGKLCLVTLGVYNLDYASYIQDGNLSQSYSGFMKPYIDQMMTCFSAR